MSQTRDGSLRTVCKLSTLDDLDGLTLTSSRRRLINVAPYGKMKKLPKFKMQATLLESLLRHWAHEGGGRFRLSGHVLHFSVDDVALITCMPKEGRLLHVNLKKHTCNWVGRQFKKVD